MNTFDAVQFGLFLGLGLGLSGLVFYPLAALLQIVKAFKQS